MTAWQASADARRTAAIGSPVVGFTDASGVADDSTIHSPGPEHAPAFTASISRWRSRTLMSRTGRFDADDVDIDPVR